MRLPAGLILGLVAAGVVAAAGPPRFTSGATRTHLLELFTSEGCSSCPPAEKRMADLRSHRGLWSEFVPVAFHVNYWDRLGWPDRFARRQFTEREHAYAAVWGSDSVYTPCFVLNGKDQRTRVTDRALALSRDPAGLLAASYEDGTLQATFTAPERGDYELHAAVLGGGIVSEVRAGENAGRTLRHEFVALALERAPLRDGTASLRLPMPKVAGVERHALAVWVTRRGQLAPVQATGGWLNDAN